MAMQSDEKLEVVSLETTEPDQSKRPAEEVLSSTAGKRQKLSNGGSEDSHEAADAVNDEEGQNGCTNSVATTSAKIKVSSDFESPSKLSLAGAQSETSVVVISEGDDEEAAAENDDAQDEEEDDEDDDDDDDDCQIVGVSHRVPAMPRSDVEYVQHLRERGLNPRELLSSLIGSDMSNFQAPEEALWQLLVRLVSEPTRRKRLDGVSTLDDVIVLLSTCQRVLVLTGAGVSVSCGIPDFRSRDGIYARLATEYPELPDPHSMFDIHYFRQDQRPFFKFAKEIYPGQFQPSPSHRFIRALEQRGKLLRNYSQNIDTLEKAAGIQRVLNCHGSFATASCMRCKFSVDCDTIKDDIMNERIPACPKCSGDNTGASAAPAAAAAAAESSQAASSSSASTGADAAAVPAVLKPDIVFFGESLPTEFYDCISQDEGRADLLIVIGSSLKVQPVSLIPTSLPSRVPQILINREPLHQHNFDVCLLGDCDKIIGELCRRLGWPGVADDDAYELREIRGEELLDRRRQAYAAEQQQQQQEQQDEQQRQADDSGSASAAAAAATTSQDAAPSTSAATAVTSSATPHEDDCNLSAYLPPGTFARFLPNKYVFPGAEAHPDEICSDEDEIDDYDDDDDEEEDEESNDEEEDDDDEEEAEELSESDPEASPVVVNLVSSDDEHQSVAEEQAGGDSSVSVEDEAAPAAPESAASSSADQDAAEIALTTVAAADAVPIEAAKPTDEIGDAEEDELLNCEVD